MVLLGVALVFITLGTFRPAESYHAIIGFSLLLILGSFLMGFGDLSVNMVVGKNVTPCDAMEIYVYGDNYTDYHWDYDFSNPPGCSNPNDFSCVRLFHTNITYDGCVESEVEIREPVTGNGIIGFLLVIFGAAGLIVNFFQLRSGGPGDEE